MAPLTRPSVPNMKAVADAYSSSSDELDGDEADETPLAHDPYNDGGGGGEFRPSRKRRRTTAAGGGQGKGQGKEWAALGVFGSDSDDERTGARWKHKSLRLHGVSFVASAPSPSLSPTRSRAPSPAAIPATAAPLARRMDERTDSQPQHHDHDHDHAGKNGDGAEQTTNEADDYNGNYVNSDGDGDDDHDAVDLGFGGPAGLGWSAPAPAATTTVPPVAFAPAWTDGTHLSGGFVSGILPESPLWRGAVTEQESEPRPAVVRPSAFSSGGVSFKGNSFGARMMAKMGHVPGKGLGKEQQGRVGVIEVALRPQGVGLGAVKEKTQSERLEEKRQARLRGEAVTSDEDEENGDKDAPERKANQRKTNQKRQRPAGSDRHGSGPKKHTIVYLTAEELRAAAPGLHIPEAFAPILDLTGPDRRILTSTSGLMTAPSGMVQAVDEEESSARTKTAETVRRAQAQISAFADEWRRLQDRKRWVELELGEHGPALDASRHRVQQLHGAWAALTVELQAAGSWDEAVACLRRHAVSLNLEPTAPSSSSSSSIVTPSLPSYSRELAEVAVAALHPFLRAAEWDPLAETGRFAGDLRALSRMLQIKLTQPERNGDDDGHGHSHDGSDDTGGLFRVHRASTTAFESMMYSLWLPAVLAAVQAWDTHKPSPMLALLEQWQDLLPAFVRAELLAAVVRRLETALAEWQPRRNPQRSPSPPSSPPDKSAHKPTHALPDPLPPHIWLFPWLPHLPADQLDGGGGGLVAAARRKFRSLAEGWDYRRGVVPGLAAWRDVLGAGPWQRLLLAGVLPALARHLRRHLRIDPAAQKPRDLAALAGAVAWAPLLTPRVVAELLAQELFPPWHACLRAWLAQSAASVDLGQVALWLAWWIHDAPCAPLRDQPAVRAHFDRASRAALDAAAHVILASLPA